MASRLNARADARYKMGTDAKTNDDRHVLSTVFFAAVLFLPAISLRLDWMPVRIGVLGFGTVLFLGAFVFADAAERLLEPSATEPSVC